MDNGYLNTADLAVGYRKKILIRDIALSVKKGELVVLIGPNGAGKSTILKSLIRQLPVISGEVRIGGAQMNSLSGQELARRVAILLTQRPAAELMTGREVVETGRYPYTGRFGILSKEDHAKVKKALALVRAEDLADRDYHTLSDGERQRILLARAICQEPELLVLDEPTAFLDIRYKLEFLGLLRELVREHRIAVLLSLHELELAQRIADRVVCVRGDTIYAEGTPEKIFCPDVICGLYDLSPEQYIESFGAVELAHSRETVPSTFVICGGGTGIPVFRRLQRQGTPFIAGVLPENDIDFPVARALAGEVISSPPYEPIPQERFQLAQSRLRTCARAICTLEHFGMYNQENRRLREYALELGLLTEETADTAEPSSL